MRLTAFASAILISVVLAAACGSSTSPSTTDNSGGITNLQSTDLRVGTGTEASNGRSLTVHYTLWLYSTTAADHRGTRIESSRDRGQPYTFTLGAGQVIPGWDQGVLGMRVGGQRTLIVPPRLAYGSSGANGIPPNASLVFDIELLDVR